MNAATVSALAGALGVVAGALVSSVGIILRERFAGRREREAQEELRKQQLTDQWATFQRESILGLQKAIGELWTQSADGYNSALQSYRETDRWPVPDIAILPEFNNVSQRIKALEACVFDDELRNLSERVMREVWAGVEKGDWSQQPEHMKAALEPKSQFHNRVNFLLKELSAPPH
jgi:hypothetical protein